MSEGRVLLIVENDPDFSRLVRDVLSQDRRIEILGEVATIRSTDDIEAEVDDGLIILDQYLDDEVKGIEAAPLLKERWPNAKILLFSSDDLSSPARAEPAIDEFLHKDHILDLLWLVQGMLGLEPV